MAKQVKVSTGPFKDLSFPGHETAEDFDREAGEVGSCVEEADASVAYRSTLPDFHKAFTETLQTMSGVTRGVNSEATEKAKARAKDPAKVDPVPESFITFANKAKQAVDETVWAQIEAKAREIALTVPIDASPSKRQAGPGKDVLAKADDILTLPADQIEAKVTKYLGKVEGFELDRDEAGKPDRSSLARLLKAYLDALLAED